MSNPIYRKEALEIYRQQGIHTSMDYDSDYNESLSLTRCLLLLLVTLVPSILLLTHNKSVTVVPESFSINGQYFQSNISSQANLLGNINSDSPIIVSVSTSTENYQFELDKITINKNKTISFIIDQRLDFFQLTL